MGPYWKTAQKPGPRKNDRAWIQRGTLWTFEGTWLQTVTSRPMFLHQNHSSWYNSYRLYGPRLHVTDRTTALNDELYTFLTEKYIVKRLGRAQDFLGWYVTFQNDGAISLTQPALVQVKIQNEDMAKANGRLSPTTKLRNYILHTRLMLTCPEIRKNTDNWWEIYGILLMH